MSDGADFAEVFVEDKQSSAVSLDDNKVESLSSSTDRGAGIRVIYGETTGFSHTSDLSLDGLLSAAKLAAQVSSSGSKKDVEELNYQPHSAPAIVRPAAGISNDEKIALLNEADSAARATNDSITQVSARVGDSRRQILVANSDGLFVTDDQTKTLFVVSTVAAGDGQLQRGSEAVGQAMGYELFDNYDVSEIAAKAANRAARKLTAKSAPAGTWPVVIGPGSGGVVFHEACGHGLEADLVYKGASVYADRVGEKVASELVTLIDDGTMAGEWGAYQFDDEGHSGAENTLIKDGILVDYMWDAKTGRKHGRTPSGNGRRQSYKHLPMTRMTNTYLAGGTQTPEEIIGAIDYGVYVASLGGGEVDTASGDFVFGMVESYLIENGELTTPLRDGQLIGNGPKVLTMISAVGNDFSMGPPGTCGKDGQGVPVGDGVPTLAVDALTVGGAA